MEEKREKKVGRQQKTITRLLKQFSSRDRNDFGLGSKQDQKALKSSLCFIVKPKYQLSVKFNNLSIFWSFTKQTQKKEEMLFVWLIFSTEIPDKVMN